MLTLANPPPHNMALTSKQPYSLEDWHEMYDSIRKRAGERLRYSGDLRKASNKQRMLVTTTNRELRDDLLLTLKRTVADHKQALALQTTERNGIDFDLERGIVDLNGLLDTCRAINEANALALDKLQIRQEQRPYDERVDDVAMIALRREVNEGTKANSHMQDAIANQRSVMDDLNAARVRVQTQIDLSQAWLNIESCCARITIKLTYGEGDEDEQELDMSTIPSPKGGKPGTLTPSPGRPAILAPLSYPRSGTAPSNMPSARLSAMPDSFKPRFETAAW